MRLGGTRVASTFVRDEGGGEIRPRAPGRVASPRAQRPRKEHADAAATGRRPDPRLEVPLPRARRSEPSDEVPAVSGRASEGPYVRSLTWAGTNRVTANGKTREVALRGVPKGATRLRGNGLHVTGLKPFVAGKGPEDPPEGTRTQRHDSFSQFVAATALRHSMDETDRVMGDGFFRSLIEARPDRHELRVLVNEGDYENAYFRSLSGTIALGTFNGDWSAADDQEVVLHELSHWDYDALVPGVATGSMNEGRADVLAMIRGRDPVIAEAWHGANGSLRRVDGDATWSNTEPGHDRGLVVSGTFFDLARVLHELYTGEPLKGGRFDQAVADDLERIYWTYPALQGTTRPDGPVFVDAMRDAIVRLDRAGKFHPRFDRNRALATLERSARARELDVSRVDDDAGSVRAAAPMERKALSVTSFSEGARAGLAAHGLDPSLHRVEEIQRMHLPGGEELRRYRVWRSLGEIEAPLVDDSLTLIREVDGSLHAQAGVLPASANPEVVLPSPALRQATERRFMAAAAADLKRLSGTLDPVALRGLPEVRPVLQLPDPKVEQHLAAVTQRMLPEVEPGWVIRDGRLELRFETDTMRYFASVDEAGRVARMERQAPITCGCTPGCC